MGALFGIHRTADIYLGRHLTVGALIELLQKEDPEMPVYGVYFDGEESVPDERVSVQRVQIDMRQAPDGIWIR